MLRAYWIALYLFQLLLAVGTKLEHIIAELVHDVAKKHTAIDGDVIVKPSDRHFWFGKPRIILYLIHFILFQNSFEIAFFFWILVSIFLSTICKAHRDVITHRKQHCLPSLMFLDNLRIRRMHHGICWFYRAEACHGVFNHFRILHLIAHSCDRENASLSMFS